MSLNIFIRVLICMNMPLVVLILSSSLVSLWRHVHVVHFSLVFIQKLSWCICIQGSNISLCKVGECNIESVVK
jgi:hypothetical protein